MPADNFRREYHVNHDGGLFAVDSWDTTDGTRVERRTTDISEEDALADRDDIELAYVLHECEQVAEARRHARHLRNGGR